MVEGRDNGGESEQVSVNKPGVAMIAFVQALALAMEARDYRLMKSVDGCGGSRQ